MENLNVEWSYTKVSYLLDTEEVILPMCAAVKRANIWDVPELVKAVLSGEAAKWPKTTKKGYKGLFRVLHNQCGVSADILRPLWAKVYA